MGKGGECPKCGDVIAKPKKAPWHFKVLIAGTSIYLSYRLYQGIDWLLHHV